MYLIGLNLSKGKIETKLDVHLKKSSKSKFSGASHNKMSPFSNNELHKMIKGNPTSLESSISENDRINHNLMKVKRPRMIQEDDVVRPAPRKGSYQEIMARAKAMQRNQSVAGIIKHKPARSLKKPESRKQSDIMQRSSNKMGKDLENELDSNRGAVASAKSFRKDPSVGKRTPIVLQYKGTMRPSSREDDTKTKKNERLVQKKRSRTTKATAYKSSSDMRTKPYHAHPSEFSDTELESDFSSDMEAAALDVQEEEEESLRVARKEDEEAMAEEQELKRRKVARKNMLT